MHKIASASEVRGGDIIIDNSSAEHPKFSIRTISKEMVVAVNLERINELKILSPQCLVSDNWWLEDEFGIRQDA
jgi:hypothetical protein